jgi:hypothetical protein
VRLTLGQGQLLAVRLALITVALAGLWMWFGGTAAGAEDRPNTAPSAWKMYTNARFGFSVRYPPDWRLGEPLPDGVGVTVTPPVPQSQVALTAFLNLVEGTSQDGRQTLDEFAAAHRRIIGEYYAKKTLPVHWQEDRAITLGGFPAKQLTFSYKEAANPEMIEMHIFSVGRNEGRGVRIKFPASSRTMLMPILAQMLQTYHPGRDQNAVSPVRPQSKPELREKVR